MDAGADANIDTFRLTYFDPPAGLEKYILALFHFEWNETEIIDRHPGALGQHVFDASLSPVGWAANLLAQPRPAQAFSPDRRNRLRGAEER